MLFFSTGGGAAAAAAAHPGLVTVLLKCRNAAVAICVHAERKFSTCAGFLCFQLVQ